MGNDGGSIPSRAELVREAQKTATTAQIKAAVREQLEYGWTTDPLSRKPLAPPIVSDAAGVLYRKESVIEYLLRLATGGSASGEDGDADGSLSLADSEAVVQGRIKSLRDVVQVHFEQGTVGKDPKPAGWICPVSRKELGPAVKAVYVVPCGHVFAASALRELESVDEGECLQCGVGYQSMNVIPILPVDPVDVEFLALRSDALRQRRLTHSLGKEEKKKSSKKRRTRERDPDEHAPALASASAPRPKRDDEPTGHKDKAPRRSEPGRSQNIQSAALAAVTAKVLREHGDSSKAQAASRSEVVSSIFHSDKKGAGRKGDDFMTRGYTFLR